MPKALRLPDESRAQDGQVRDRRRRLDDDAGSDCNGDPVLEFDAEELRRQRLHHHEHDVRADAAFRLRS